MLDAWRYRWIIYAMFFYSIQVMRSVLLVGIAAAMLSGCTCSEKKKSNDPVRLKTRIDVAPVHLYAATKAALGSNEADADFVAVRDKVLKLLVTGEIDNIGAVAENLSFGDLMVLGKAVLSFKNEGQQIVGGSAPEGEPLIRKLLLLLETPPGLADLVDANTDHALLFLAEGAMKLQQSDPVPIPEEVILYEAWRTDAEKLSIPGMNALVHGLRAYYYGRNDLCDLAREETKATKSGTEKLDIVLKGVGIFTEGAAQANTDEVKALMPVLRMLADSGVAICHYRRGDDKSARPWLKQMLDEVKSTSRPGMVDTGLLDIFYHCGGGSDDIAMGTRALAHLPPSADPDTIRDRQMVGAYCQTPPESRTAVLRQFTLVSRLTTAALTPTRNARLIAAIKRSRAYRAAVGVAVLSDKAAAASKSVTGAVDALKGLFSKE